MSLNKENKKKIIIIIVIEYLYKNKYIYIYIYNKFATEFTFYTIIYNFLFITLRIVVDHSDKVS